MGMTPHEFFESFVLGNLEDCREAPGSVRRALNAAISASHLADHWLAFNERHNPALFEGLKDVGHLVERLADSTDGAFRDIRSIANAYKHLYTDSDSTYGAFATVDSAGAIVSVELPGNTEVVSVAEHHDGPSSRVLFTRRDGTTREFLPVLEAVVTFWQATLYSGA